MVTFQIAWDQKPWIGVLAAGQRGTSTVASFLEGVVQGSAGRWTAELPAGFFLIGGGRNKALRMTVICDGTEARIVDRAVADRAVKIAHRDEIDLCEVVRRGLAEPPTGAGKQRPVGTGQRSGSASPATRILSDLREIRRELAEIKRRQSALIQGVGEIYDRLHRG